MDFFSGTFGIFSGGIFDFFLAHRFFFLGCNFANFFTGTTFFSRAVFKIFSRALANFLGQNLENFLVENFFFLGEKKNTGGWGATFWFFKSLENNTNYTLVL